MRDIDDNSTSIPVAGDAEKPFQTSTTLKRNCPHHLVTAPHCQHTALPHRPTNLSPRRCSTNPSPLHRPTKPSPRHRPTTPSPHPIAPPHLITVLLPLATLQPHHPTGPPPHHTSPPHHPTIPPHLLTALLPLATLQPHHPTGPPPHHTSLPHHPTIPPHLLTALLLLATPLLHRDIDQPHQLTIRKQPVAALHHLPTVSTTLVGVLPIAEVHHNRVQVPGTNRLHLGIHCHGRRVEGVVDVFSLLDNV
ncbi:hypothetical protein L1987_64386 [Smallanthus sonchifolius]|uniref:Uncharacterized protein n=1 Tax=Smallanthus sonchifolius TaxID=185202 RepID=A0ACB9CFX9_9ASTR|nr:hypothetical protein L1987_64386 [Smallanthus sonchifolius]